jgi:HEAT repeat protein
MTARRSDPLAAPPAASRFVAVVAVALSFALSFALCVAPRPAAAQGMPSTKPVESWLSTRNRNLLKVEWDGVPEYLQKKNPDGSPIPPRAPWPFLLFVKGAESKEAGRIQNVVFMETRVALASKVVRFTQLSPEKALDQPWLKGVNGIKDPSLLVLDRDFKVLGLVNEWKDFDDRAVLPILVKAADANYPVKLGAFVASFIEQLEIGEGLWKKEQRIVELQKKIGKSNQAQQKQIDDECDKLNKEVEDGQDGIDKRLKEIVGAMVPKEPEAAALPTTTGSGKNKRKLTKQELEAIEAFREYARNENPLVRAAAVEDLGNLDSDAIVELILSACTDTDERVIEAAGRGLGKMSSDAALAAMLEALDSGNSKARAAACFGFARVKRPYPAAVPKLASFLKGSDDDVRRAAVQALANMKDPSTAEGLIEALDDKIPALRVLAAQALGELRQEKSVPGLVAALNNEDWTLRKASAEALGKVRSRDSIEPLIARFETEQGIVVETIYKALVDVTGQDHSYDPKHWRRWWELAKKDFAVPSDHDVKLLKEKVAAAMAQYQGPEKKKYHTIETFSKRMIFVIDISASMGDKIPIPDSATKEQVDAFGTRVKMEIAKNELIALLSTLPDDVEFNIITFAGSSKPWQGGLVGAGSRAAAIKFVSKLKALEPVASAGRARGPATGGSDEQKTNTYGAILAAFGFADEGTPDWKKRGKVDTLFFVTDGLPTTGQVVDVQKMIEIVTEMNRTRGLTIHLVMFDKEAAERMRGLAEKNGGKCVVRSLDTAK